MSDQWEKALSCAEKCTNCEAILEKRDQRVLSVYTHAPICLNCKQAEEQRPDYEETSKNMIGQCMAETELLYSDPQGYCFYHFYPFTCD